MAQVVQDENVMNILMLQEEGKKLEEHLNALNQQAVELITLQEHLNDFHETKEKEFLAHFGKGIFFKSEIKEKEFFVNIGAGIVLKKSHQEASEIINRQVLQIEKIKEDLIGQIEMINTRLVEIVEKVQREREEKGD